MKWRVELSLKWKDYVPKHVKFSLVTCRRRDIVFYYVNITIVFDPKQEFKSTISLFKNLCRYFAPGFDLILIT